MTALKRTITPGTVVDRGWETLVFLPPGFELVESAREKWEQDPLTGEIKPILCASPAQARALRHHGVRLPYYLDCLYCPWFLATTVMHRLVPRRDATDVRDTFQLCREPDRGAIAELKAIAIAHAYYCPERAQKRGEF